MPRREGRKDNVKRVYRLYREERLSLRLPGLTRTIKTHNGSALISKVMDNYRCRVELDFSRPCKPTDNARVKSVWAPSSGRLPDGVKRPRIFILFSYCQKEMT